MKRQVIFSTCSIFQPGQEATGYVVQAQDKDSLEWWYLLRPLKGGGVGFFMWDQAMATAKKVALAGEIDASRWYKSYPLSDFELLDWETEASLPQSA